MQHHREHDLRRHHHHRPPRQRRLRRYPPPGQRLSGQDAQKSILFRRQERHDGGEIAVQAVGAIAGEEEFRVGEANSGQRPTGVEERTSPARLRREFVPEIQVTGDPYQQQRSDQIHRGSEPIGEKNESVPCSGQNRHGGERRPEKGAFKHGAKKAVRRRE